MKNTDVKVNINVDSLEKDILDMIAKETTLEEDILNLMTTDITFKKNNKSFTDTMNKNSFKEELKKTELKNIIKDVVYDVLKEILGSTLISKHNPRSFQEQLFWTLEKNGFSRNCPTCYFNTVKLGKLHSDFTKCS